MIARSAAAAFRDRLDLARHAEGAIAGSQPTAAAAPTRPIPIRTVPRAAVEALVARLVASGAVERPGIWGPPDTMAR